MSEPAVDKQIQRGPDPAGTIQREQGTSDLHPLISIKFTASYRRFFGTHRPSGSQTLTRNTAALLPSKQVKCPFPEWLLCWENSDIRSQKGCKPAVSFISFVAFSSFGRYSGCKG
jgi:hypothetical protein